MVAASDPSAGATCTDRLLTVMLCEMCRISSVPRPTTVLWWASWRSKRKWDTSTDDNLVVGKARSGLRGDTYVVEYAWEVHVRGREDCDITGFPVCHNLEGGHNINEEQQTARKTYRTHRELREN